jgi:HNH endonuclease
MPVPPISKISEPRTIRLYSGIETLVSPEWYEKLVGYSWFKGAGGYAVRKEHGQNVYMARQILNAPSHLVVDHIDRNKLNNQTHNLRLCTRRGNQQNQGVPRDNTSGYKGVSWQCQIKRWQAKIQANCVAHYIGVYETKEEAALAYNEAARRLHGEFAYLNEVPK